MLTKLLKFELKENFKKGKILYLCIFIVTAALAWMLYAKTNNVIQTASDARDIFLGLFAFLYTIAVGAVACSYIYMIFNNYYQRFFGPAAVFYRTLPAKYDKKTVAITLGWGIYSAVTVLVVALSFAMLLGAVLLKVVHTGLADAHEIQQALATFWKLLMQKEVFIEFTVSILLASASAVLFAFRAFFIVNVTHLGSLRHSSWKIPVGLFSFFILNYLESFFFNFFRSGKSFLSTVDFIQGLDVFSTGIQNRMFLESFNGQTQVAYVIGTLVITAIFSGFYYFMNQILVKEIDF